jgi:hypothetical protein
MAWLSRVNFISSDTLSFTDVNNLGNDIRAWGDNVNGGGYTLSNVAISASSGTMGLVIGGTGTTSTLRLRSTSGVGTTGADIIFQAGNNGATEVMRLQNGGNVGIGTSTVSAKLHVTAGDAATANGQLIISGGRSLGTAMGSAGGILFSNSYWNSGFGAAGIYAGDNGGAGGNLMFATLSTGGGQSGSPSERMRIDSSGNVGIGTSTPVSSARLDLTKSITVGSLSTMRQLRIGIDSNSDYSGYIGYGDNSAGFYGLVLQGLHANVATASFIALQPSGGNVSVGGMAARATTVGTNVFNIFDGSAPVGTLANGCSFYSTAGEMRVMDAAGNATLLSPHDSQTNEWIYDSSHTPTGKRLKIDVERLLRFLNDHFGLDCVHDFIQEN